MPKYHVDNGARAPERKHYYHPVGGGANWADLDGQKLIEYIAVVAENGGAIRLGYTRDGGAYSIGVYGDGEQPYTDYLRPSEDVLAYLQELADSFRDARVSSKQLKLPGT